MLHRRHANGCNRRYLVIAARSGKVCLLTRQPTFGVGDEDYSSCPQAVLHLGPEVAWAPTNRNEAEVGRTSI